jgi:predicted NBD/HSP70 family sugar kinase
VNCAVVDLGGTNLRCGLVSSAGKLVLQERTKLGTVPQTRGDAIWTRIVNVIAGFISDHAAAIAHDVPVAIAFPGPILDDRAVGQAPTVAGDAIVPDIVAMVRSRVRHHVVMLNDVSAAAWYFEERMPVERFAIVTVSSGIGCKVFDRGRPGVIDDVAYAGEIGHLIVDRSSDPLLCDCGGRGHLGAISSGRGFERFARRAAQADPAAFAASACAKQFGAVAETLNNEIHLVPAVIAGDRWANTILAATVAPLAETVGVMTIACGLEGLVIMGGFAQSLGEAYKRTLSHALGTISDCGAARVALGDFIMLAEPGAEPGLIGAARYARTRRAVVA